MRALLPFGLLAATCLSACTGLTPYAPGPSTLIASPNDTGFNRTALVDGNAAIAYDPDGCQGWIIDHGVEGYSGRRYDPKSGLPVCNGIYPPGTVVGDYRRQNSALRDWVPTR